MLTPRPVATPGVLNAGWSNVLSTRSTPQRWWEDPPPQALSLSYSHAEDLYQLRQTVAGYAQQAGMTEPRLGHLLVAVSELATNTIRYTPGPGLLTVWHTSEHLFLQVSDEGKLPPVAAGSMHPFPPPNAAGGFGLALVGQFSDQMLIEASPAVIRLRFQLT